MGLLLEGDSAAMLAAVRDHYALGVEPLALMRGLLELAHAVTVAKAGRGEANAAQSVEEREALADWAAQLGFAPLHRLWQLLLKGHDEVASAVMPIEACEMALLRVIHAATMPDPGELARLLREGGPVAGAAPAAAPPAANLPGTAEDIVELLWKHKRGQMAEHFRDCAALVSLAPPVLEIRLTSAWTAGDFHRDLAQILRTETGIAWQVRHSDGDAQPTLMEQEQARVIDQRAAILETPVVAAALAAFPDAELDERDQPEPWSMTQ
jgi:DNA polymerase-3 subunit gamma/tau